MGTIWMIATMAAAVPAVASARDAELHTFHCLHGCPVGAPGTNDVVVREIYTLSSNDLTKMADWVAYRVTKESIGQSGDRDWRADGRATAFVFDQAASRGDGVCAARVFIRHVELRSRLRLFPDATNALMPLDLELGCSEQAATDPTPSEIPAEKRSSRRRKVEGPVD